MRASIGRYRVDACLGEGGMGVVYSAWDDRLSRRVAVKTIKDSLGDARARERFWREARTAAGLSHPAVCQVHEVGEEADELFIVMELLEGEALSSRLTRGALPIDEAVPVALGVLDALEALHTRGFLHRDIKPSNIFLTPHGIKLLDFGLARALVHPASDLTLNAVTQPGTVVGTPYYMPPEALSGLPVDTRADLYAVGVVLFEMVSGHPPFRGGSLPEIIRAIAYDRPPVLGGSPAAAIVDRVVNRALAKSPADRYASAREMASDLRTSQGMDTADVTASARVVARVIALPFRVLRHDPDTDFLAFSLPDAVSSSLSSLGSVIVRSSHTAAKFGGDAPDLKAIAAEAEVEAVLLGTLLRAGSRLRVTAQLVEAPSGTVLCSHSSQVEISDIFELQDSLARAIAEAIAAPLGTYEARPKRDVPASSHAYELYLKANRAGHQASVSSGTASWEAARELYLQCVGADPAFAPAWARLGRIYRLMAKWGRHDDGENLARADAAVARALELNPGLGLAHNLQAQLEIDRGRPEDAMLRLLARTRTQGADPELFAGLVQACRYAGLYEASVAAHRAARRLDPAILTGVGHSYFLLGDYERVIDPDLRMTPVVFTSALAMLDREDEAAARCRETEHKVQTRYEDILRSHRALYEGKHEESLRAARRFLDVGIQDPEGVFYTARVLARLGERAMAIKALQDAYQTGYRCYLALERDRWFDSLRGDPVFEALVAEAGQRYATNQSLFRESGGHEALGVES